MRTDRPDKCRKSDPTLRSDSFDNFDHADSLVIVLFQISAFKVNVVFVAALLSAIKLQIPGDRDSRKTKCLLVHASRLNL